MRGVLIAFEGIEGSGKSTQAKRLYSFLQAQQIPCIISYEPGGTEIGNQIREILLSVKNKKMHRKTELLLYLASRAQHVYEKIMPALAQGTVVVTDRFSLSSMAYQGMGRDFSFKVVSRLNNFAIAGIKPDLTILVDLPVPIGLGRTEKRSGEKLDRLEKERYEFHEKIRRAYLNLAKKAPKKIMVFSGEKNEQDLFTEIKEKIEVFLKKRGII
ncbi:MAG: dTMP kinase [Candidatus Latescibacteria bacterium]|nr:dTMP kinase [Candidatus Latescibacterota bacterium]